MNSDLFKKYLNELSERISKSDHKEVYIRVNSVKNLIQIYLNLNKSNEVWLSIFHSTDNMQLNSIPSISGLEISNILHENGRKGTKIGKEESHDEGIYHNFLIHLVEELSNFNKSSLARRRLQHLLHIWQEFFKGNRKPLGEKAQLGLMGELAVLKNMVLAQLDPIYALDTWKGPLHGLHDFIFEFCHLEVKSSIGINDRHFIINGESQLKISPEKKLYLVNPVFHSNDNGYSLSEMIVSINDLISSDQIALDIMETLLVKAGYHHIHSNYYRNDGLKVSLECIYSYYIADGFPKLLPGSSGDYIKVNNYIIDEKGCRDFLHEEEIRLI